jgi:tetratricopeptide (TPR) repeat protein
MAKLTGDSAELRLIRGQELLAKKATALAIAEFKQAIVLDPSRLDAYGILGRAYEKIGDFPNALEIYKKYLALNPPLRQLVEEAKRRIELNERRISTGEGIPASRPDPQSITAADRDMIRALLPVFSAINSKDYATLKRLNMAMRDTPVASLEQGLRNINGHVFHGVEHAVYKGDKLQGTVLYTADTIDPRQLANKTLSPFVTDVVMVREGSDRVISTWIPYEAGTGFTDRRNLDYFGVVLGHIEDAEKRFGVKDISKWPGL